MLVAYSFTAEPTIGHESEEVIESVRGFIICSAPDPDAFVRDRLGERGLTIVEVHYTDHPSPAGLSNLPEKERQDLDRDGWCIVLQETLRG